MTKVCIRWQSASAHGKEDLSAKSGVIWSQNLHRIDWNKIILNLHCESKKGATLTMAITLSILDRFAKFFHCCKEQ